MKGLNDQQSRGAIFKINMLMLMALLQGALAYASWPTSKEWWMFGIMSILLGAAAFASFIQVMRLIWQIYRRDRIFGTFRNKGGEQKSSHMASRDALKQAGMLDD